MKDSRRWKLQWKWRWERWRRNEHRLQAELSIHLRWHNYFDEKIHMNSLFPPSKFPVVTPFPKLNRRIPLYHLSPLPHLPVRSLLGFLSCSFSTPLPITQSNRMICSLHRSAGWCTTPWLGSLLFCLSVLSHHLSSPSFWVAKPIYDCAYHKTRFPCSFRTYIRYERTFALKECPHALTLYTTISWVNVFFFCLSQK